MFADSTDFTEIYKCTNTTTVTTTIVVKPKTACSLEKIIEIKEKQFEQNLETIKEVQTDSEQQKYESEIDSDTNDADKGLVHTSVKVNLTPTNEENSSLNSNNLMKIGNQKKETRSTSTPMHQFFFTKNIKTNTFNMSSINVTTSDSETSPPASSLSLSMNSAKKSNNNSSSNVRHRYHSVAQTPLRQVMSKSIQRAIVQHGHEFNFRPKKIFDSSNESSNNSTTVSSPLDLRTTPVLRRTKSEACDFRKIEMKQVIKPLQLNPFKKMDNEKKRINSIPNENPNLNLIQCKDNYKINNDNHEIKLNKIDQFYDLQTPKFFGASAIKKTISFNTPPHETPVAHETTKDVWFTPGEIPPRSLSCSALNVKEVTPTTMRSIDISDLPLKNHNDDGKVLKENDRTKGGKLWSILASVMRIASFGGAGTIFKEKSPNKKIIIESPLKSASSLEDFIKKENASETDDDEDQPYKRRKILPNISSFKHGGNLIKRKKIKGRPPIRHMRNNPS